jgi:hypothetical protein
LVERPVRAPRSRSSCMTKVVLRLRRTPDLGRDRHDRRPPRGVLHHHPDRSIANLRRILRCMLLAHGSNFSKSGASGKPGAVQPRRTRAVQFTALRSDGTLLSTNEIVAEMLRP